MDECSGGLMSAWSCSSPLSSPTCSSDPKWPPGESPLKPPWVNHQDSRSDSQSSPLSGFYEELYCSRRSTDTQVPLVTSHGALVTSQGPRSDVVRTGYLGKADRHHRRFFVLRAGSHTGPGRLEWFKSQDKFDDKTAGKASLFGSNKQGVMYLRCCLGVSRLCSPRKGHTVALYAQSQTLLLCAEDRSEQDGWFQAIRTLMEEETREEHSTGCDDEDDGYCTLPPAAFFKEVWPVLVRSRDLGCSKSLAGASRLCLTASSLILMRVGAGSDPPSVTIPLLSVRRFGHLDGSFFLELGRSAPHGPGEIWMEAGEHGNPSVAQNIHEVVRETVRSLRALPDFSLSPTSNTHTLASKRCRPRYRAKALNIRPIGPRLTSRNPESPQKCNTEPIKTDQTESESTLSPPVKSCYHDIQKSPTKCNTEPQKLDQIKPECTKSPTKYDQELEKTDPESTLSPPIKSCYHDIQKSPTKYNKEPQKPDQTEPVSTVIHFKCHQSSISKTSCYMDMNKDHSKPFNTDMEHSNPVNKEVEHAKPSNKEIEPKLNQVVPVSTVSPSKSHQSSSSETSCYMDMNKNHFKPFNKKIERSNSFNKKMEHSKPFNKDMEHSKPVHKEVEHSNQHKVVEHSKSVNKEMEPSKPFNKHMEHSKSVNKEVDHSKSVNKEVDHSKPVNQEVEPSKSVNKEVEPSKPFNKDMEHSKSVNKEVEHSKSVNQEVEHSKSVNKEVEHSKSVNKEVEHSKSVNQEVEHSKSVNKEVEHSKPVNKEVEHSKSVNKEVEHSKPVNKEVEHSKSVKKEVEHSKSVNKEVEHSKSVNQEVEHSKSVNKEVEHSKPVNKEVEHSKSVNKEVEHSKPVNKEVEHSKSVKKEVEHSKSVNKEVEHSKSVNQEVEHSKSVNKEVEHSKPVDKEMEHSKQHNKDVEHHHYKPVNKESEINKMDVVEEDERPGYMMMSPRLSYSSSSVVPLDDYVAMESPHKHTWSDQWFPSFSPRTSFNSSTSGDCSPRLHSPHRTVPQPLWLFSAFHRPETQASQSRTSSSCSTQTQEDTGQEPANRSRPPAQTRPSSSSSSPVKSVCLSVESEPNRTGPDQPVRRYRLSLCLPFCLQAENTS